MKPHRNKGLFSNYYLEELLPREEEFKIPPSELERILGEVKQLWDKKYLSSLNEPQLRKDFLDKAFEILGWTIDVEPPTPPGGRSKRPHYALFHSEADLTIAREGTAEEYFKKVVCIGEAKRWGRPLDRKIEVDPEDPQNPSLQISSYLWLTGAKWGILTDGRYWRLYEREASKRVDIFYEIDLDDLIEKGTKDDFKYFYLFFRQRAFPDFLEKVSRESVDYTEGVGEELKENVYLALKTLAEGLVKTRGGNLSEADLKAIHDNSVILLYRLLFILYAEHGGLLPVEDNQLYRETYSLDALKKEIAFRLDRGEPVPASTHGYWYKLGKLFETINVGNTELGVPPYNGGLFNPGKHKFLDEHRVGDSYIVKAIDLLSRSHNGAFIDYGSLEIRHLGSIYEGLLECKLRIAKEDIVPVREKGEEVFIPFEEAQKARKKIKGKEIVRKDDVYLVTDRGGHKATGSFYTPRYIAEYIIENTLAPIVERIYKETEWAHNIRKTDGHFDQLFKEIVDERRNGEKENLLRLWNVIRDNQERRDFLLNLLDGAEPSHGYDPVERILQLRILEPAMGSGHFLVGATDFLARELLKALSGDPLVKPSKNVLIREASGIYGRRGPEEEDIRWARREVVERCIFGVDLNPLAVELAKLSLWLYTVAENRPLNFLDHHLRCGNSLIGAWIDDLGSLPELKKKKAETGPVQLGLFEIAFRERVNILLKSFELIGTRPSDNVEQIRRKEKLYLEFRKVVSRFQDVADVWTSVFFGNDEVYHWYPRLERNLRARDKDWERLMKEPWFKWAKEIAEERRFFHWELEFPEVFFEGNQRKDSPGFDAVVGNPPYVRDNEHHRILLEERKVLKEIGQYSCLTKKWLLYVAFVERSLQLCRTGGMSSLIVPDVIDREEYAATLRRFVAENFTIRQLDYFPNIELFAGAGIKNLIYLIEKLPSSKSWKPTKRLHLDGTTKKFDTVPSDSQQKAKGAIFRLDYVPVRYLGERSFIPIHHLFYISVGMVLNSDEKVAKGEFQKDDLISPFKDQIHCKPLADNDVVCRYGLGTPKWLEYNTARVPGMIRRPTFPELHVGPRLLFTRSQGAVFTADDVVCDQRVMTLKPWIFLKGVNNKSITAELRSVWKKDGLGRGQLQIISEIFNPLYILAILNSQRILNLVVEGKRDRYDLTPDVVRQFPIRRVSFVTPKETRVNLFDEAKGYYEKYLETTDPDAILHFVESRFMNQHTPDPQLVKRHNAEPLNKGLQIPENALWEQSDVIHDLLAFLAERMIEMNKEKQEEIKAFLEWLESQLKIQIDTKGHTGIEALTGKTQIKSYLANYQKGKKPLSFEEFWQILERNKKRIHANLKSRELLESIKTEYEKSLSRLLPLKDKLQKTDWLIDQIVHTLYGLSEDEIKIAEGR